MPTKKKTPAKRRVTRTKSAPDMAAARELVLYIANTETHAKEVARSPAAWGRMFTVPTRDLAARNLAHNFITYYAGRE